MAERLRERLRPTGMWMRVLGLSVALPIALSGCGDDGDPTDAATEPLASTSETACASTEVNPGPGVPVDLDGDGAREPVSAWTLDGPGCPPAALDASVGGNDISAAVTGDLPVEERDLSAIRVPGRTGDVVLVRQTHPRGGFQARLYGYADGRLEELTVGGNPIFPFVATDAMTDPIAARCVEGGFEVTEAKAHTPIGVVPAWDVFRTTYTVDGNHVTKGATTEVAENVLDKDLHRKYHSLVAYSLFENCLAGS